MFHHILCFFFYCLFCLFVGLFFIVTPFSSLFQRFCDIFCLRSFRTFRHCRNFFFGSFRCRFCFYFFIIRTGWHALFLFQFRCSFYRICFGPCLFLLFFTFFQDTNDSNHRTCHKQNSSDPKNHPFSVFLLHPFVSYSQTYPTFPAIFGKAPTISFL